MAIVIVTLKIMPGSPDSDLDAITEAAKAMIVEHGAQVHKTENKPVAFGLQSINIMFSMDESKGSTDALEEKIAGIESVNSVDVIDVRRAVG